MVWRNAVDTIDKETRSRVMARVRSHGNKTTERKLRMMLVRAHFVGWRVLPQHLPGNPDFTFPDASLAIFVDGCFWHGCPTCYRRPSSNRKYWDAKVERNRARDKRLRGKLRKAGWSVIRIWEHELENPEKVISRLEVALGRRRGQNA